MKETYIIGDRTITRTGAANFISQKLFPEPEHRTYSRRISDTIKRAQNAGLLPLIEAIPADIFFGWAIEQKGWQGLSKIPGIPIYASVLVEGVAGTGNTAEVTSAASIPDDYESLKAEFKRAIAEIDLLKRQCSTLQAQLRKYEQAERAAFIRNSENGKTGGRGNGK